jgi:hypothetical protein
MWLASLVAVGALTSAASVAQTKLLEREYKILPSTDIGFRVEGTDMTGKPIGTFMFRIDGRWVEMGSGPVVRRTK